MEKLAKEIKLVGRGNPKDLAEMVRPVAETCKRHGIVDAKITISVDPNVGIDDKDDATKNADHEPAFDPKSDEWSKDEKFVLCQAFPEEGILPFELEPITCANGAVEYLYKISPTRIRAALELCHGTEGLLDTKKEIFDLHSKKTVTVDELRILRYKGRNIVVSPYYAESGGMLVDLIDRSDINGDGMIISDVEGK